MPIASDSATQKEYSAKKGIKVPRVTSGMNKLPSTSLATQKSDERSDADTSKKKATDDASIIHDAKERFAHARTVESTNRKDGIEDLEFLNNKQWNPADEAERAADRRPCITENRLPTFANQIKNEQRQNRPAIVISPMGDKASKKDAKMLRGMVRAIERDSSADVAYDTGFASSVDNGWGYWRILTEYEAPMSFNKVLCVKPIPNPMNVYLDPNRTPFMLDYKWGIITEMLPRDDFEREYPNASPMPWGESGIGEDSKEWITKDEIRVAEYYYFEYEERCLVLLDNGHEGWKDELSEQVIKLIDTGKMEIIADRYVQVPQLKWCKMTAIEILDSHDCDGDYVPIVECIGSIININGKETKKGMIRDAKGPQRMLNYYAPLALDTPIPTPSGWTTIGEIKVGDKVFDECGKPASVVGMSPTYVHRDCYRVTFEDGSSIVADAQHPWLVKEKQQRTSKITPYVDRIISTLEMIPGKHFIPTHDALDTPDIDLPIHPYLLGAWLGDGSRYEPSLCAGDQDMGELRTILEGFGHDLSPIHYSGERVGWFTVYGVRKHFSSLGLLRNKHIPAMYLRASRHQRELLLQGMMDTDGSVSKNLHQCTFVNTDSALISGFLELIRSLGLKSFSCVQNGEVRLFPGGYESVCQPSSHIYFTPNVDDQVFRFQRKLLIQKKDRNRHSSRTNKIKIRSIEPVQSVPVRCISVDTPSHLFLAGDGMLVTHNTLEAENVALQPKAPWIMEEGQIDGHEDKWNGANRKSYSYLLYKGTNIAGKQAPPPQRQPFQGPPAAILAAKQGNVEALRAVTGIRFDATMSERMQDESGKAIRELNNNANLGAYHFIDNYGRALRNTGIIMCNLIPPTYDTKRIVSILDETGAEDRVMINPNMAQAHAEVEGMSPESSMLTKIKMFNPKVGRYQVTVTIGPSHATKRVEAMESQMDFVRVLPELGMVVADLIAKNSDWEGAEEFANRIAKTLPAKLLTPSHEDMNPQIEALIQGLQTHIEELNQQMSMMGKELQDRQADRDVALEGIAKKFEAEVLKIAERLEANADKKEMHMQATIGRQLAEIVKSVQSVEQQAKKPKRTAGFTIENGK